MKMHTSHLKNDPITRALFRSITDKKLFTPEEPKCLNENDIRNHLNLLGSSDDIIKAVINDLYKDLKLLEGASFKLRELKKNTSCTELNVFFFKKLQAKFAGSISKKIIEDDKRESSNILYAKLHILKKFMEHSHFPEMVELVSSNLKKSFDSTQRTNRYLDELSEVKKPDYPKDSNVISLSKYRLS